MLTCTPRLLQVSFQFRQEKPLTDHRAQQDHSLALRYNISKRLLLLCTSGPLGQFHALAESILLVYAANCKRFLVPCPTVALD